MNRGERGGEQEAVQQLCFWGDTVPFCGVSVAEMLEWKREVMGFACSCCPTGSTTGPPCVCSHKIQSYQNCVVPVSMLLCGGMELGQ